MEQCAVERMVCIAQLGEPVLVLRKDLTIRRNGLDTLLDCSALLYMPRYGYAYLSNNVMHSKAQDCVVPPQHIHLIFVHQVPVPRFVHHQYPEHVIHTCLRIAILDIYEYCIA